MCGKKVCLKHTKKLCCYLKNDEFIIGDNLRFYDDNKGFIDYSYDNDQLECEPTLIYLYVCDDCFTNKKNEIKDYLKKLCSIKKRDIESNSIWFNYY